MIIAQMMRMLLAAGLAWLGIGLAGLSAACDSEPQQSAEADAELLDAMIGQMIMVGFDGRSERDPGVIAVRDQLAKGTIGGVVLYPRNIGSPEQLRALTAYLRNAKSSPIPFIAVDQEGGVVQRLTPQNGHGYFPSARSVGANPSFASPEAAERLYATMAEDLAGA
ncbi:MAG TPA: glycoside hydrolase family 3 N-terminal domain-containing protein, partial [Methyloceanibacter sp.]|nr:glycoside hydrolase family 3 N-terminal domain-containing protein [Methyloceanibacter sp.]